MEKINLKSQKKQLLTAFLLLLIALSGAGLFWSLTRPAETTEEYTALSYYQEAGLDYRVHLRPNEFFPETVQGPGRAYITELAEHLSTDFAYRFTVEREAQLKGQYSVNAVLTATTGREKKYTVWEQSEELLPPQSFSSEDMELAIQQDVTVPISDYIELTGRLTEETGFVPEELNLAVTYHVTVEAETDSGPIREELVSTMVVPLRGRTFTVGLNPGESRTGTLTAIRQVPVQLVEETRLGFSVTTVITLLLLAALLFFTAAAREEKPGPAEKKLARILKQHGDRLVAFRKEMYSLATDRVLEVNSFEDLIKAADELAKPVLYNQPKTVDGCEHSFFVVAETGIYRYTIE